MANTDSLTDAEQHTVKTAAYGAIVLLSLAYPSARSTTKLNVVGAKVLTGATGLIGHILATRSKTKLKGSAADVAATVLPAINAAVQTLRTKAPTELAEFQRVVRLAMDQAARAVSTGEISPAHAQMIDKISNALEGWARRGYARGDGSRLPWT